MTQRSVLPKPSSREDWLAARRPYFNASAAAVLFDRHPYLSPGNYTRTKLSGEEQRETTAMIRGRMMEDALARWFAYEHHVELVEPDVLYVCDRVMATVDRLLVTDADDTPVEIKTTNLYTDGTAETHWLDQCQAIMLAGGWTELVLVWVDAGMRRLYHRTIFADETWQAAIAKRAEQFMSFIDLGMVPEGVQLDYEDAGKVFPVAEVAKVDLDVEAAMMVAAYRNARTARLEAERDEKLAKGAIAQALGTAEVGMYHGEPIVEWRQIKPTTRLDTTALHAAEPEVWERFAVTTPQRRMFLVGDQEVEA